MAKLKIFSILYRLTLPGGLLVVMAALLVKVGGLADPNLPLARAFPMVIFAIGLGVSSYFRRSRLFFAFLSLTLAQVLLMWAVPVLSPDASRVVVNSIAILLPLNLVLLAFMDERGIISPTGRRRLAIVALEIITVCVLSTPWLSTASPARYLDASFVPLTFSAWSHLSQPALAVFLLSAVTVMVLLVRRYRAVESSLLWSIFSSYIAFRMGATNHIAGVFFATGGLALIVALIEQSYSMAYRDELTQLPSRRALNEALMKLPDNYTVAMVDVDHFKKFNDSYGHESGDQALRLVAARLARIAGGGCAYRYGGEEFAVIFPNRSSDEVFIYLDRMRKIIEQSKFTVRGKDRRRKQGIGRGAKKQTSVTVSIGVASCLGDKALPTDILRIADQALYKAKERGRNCVVTAKASKSVVSAERGLRILSVS